MSIEKDIIILSQVGLFQDFSPEQLRLIAFGSQKRIHPQGTELFKQGDNSDGGFVVLSGHVQLVSGSAENNKVLGDFRKASLIGEMSLITETNRNATAVVCEQSEIVKISRLIVSRVLQEYPELAANLHHRISESVQGILDNLENVRSNLAN